MNFIETELSGGLATRVDALRDDLLRVRIVKTAMEFEDTGLNRYGFIKDDFGSSVSLEVAEADGVMRAVTERLAVSLKRDTGEIIIEDVGEGSILSRQITAAFDGGGARVAFEAEEGVDWVGFGDQTRERLYHRGHRADCKVRNVKSYIPVPFFMSTTGVGILVNTTRRVSFDMCATDPDRYSWFVHGGGIDYYVMAGKDFRSLIGAYTDLTGKPKLPPAWAFGLWYVCRDRADVREVIEDALNFRREEIPCDVIGLEPGWMETRYDLSTEKKWNPERFPIPPYCVNGPNNFLDAIKRMGFHVELWLCNEYDLSHEEERRLDKRKREVDDGETAVFHDAAEVDEHFNTPRYLDPHTKPDEPWFEHLKKFVDQGIDFFKQDGAFQICDHPDRLWGNGMTDEEMHNLYPLLYCRQMLEGFENHAGRRGVVFTPAGWTGFQAWCGTWTGDTGGGLDTLPAMLNTSLVGHSWVTNDMQVVELEGVHFGYLQPWSQINSWNYFRMPWIQGQKVLEAHKFYARLRSRLVPYIYSHAYQSTLTGYPLMVPLTLEFPDDSRCGTVLHQYLLGRDLMVVVYKSETVFPEGRWKDYWTGKITEGGTTETIAWPENRGGGLYVRSGGIVPLGPVMRYRGERPLDDVDLYLFPDRIESSFELYEDDGVSFDHLEGRRATTPISTVVGDEGRISVNVGETAGDFEGQTTARRWGFVIAVDAAPLSVVVNGEELDSKIWRHDPIRGELSIPAMTGPLEVVVKTAP